ncbi:unnamed protein product [Lymnaea stagnalis]|uniref:Tetratricopeptide repeat protein 37 n=1 Tax=Lymnaea stagnalis TaxID=6523 RepID=A0AAV2HAP0_LYMST
MDAKEIKTCLKGARDAIREKDYKEALRQSKAVLAVEKDNYNALVFVGLAAEGMDQPEQGLKAYKRAAERQPEQLLAWQGLANIVDKNPQLMGTDEAKSIYEKLVFLSASDHKKLIGYSHKLVELFIKSKDMDKALETLTNLLNLEKEGDGRLISQRSIITLLASSAPKLTRDKLDLYQTALLEVLQSPSLSQEEINEYTSQFLLLTSQIKIENIQAVSQDLVNRFPQAAPPLEFLLRCHLDANLGNGNVSVETCQIVTHLTNKLLSFKPESPLIKVGQAFIALQEKRIVEAVELIQDCTSDNISAVYFLSYAFLLQHKNQICLETCEKGLSACASSKRMLCAPAAHVMALFKLIQAEALRQIGTNIAREKALAVLEEVSEKMPNESFLIKSFVLLDQGNIDEAELSASYLPQEMLPVQTLKASILFEKMDYNAALKILENVLKEDPSDFIATLKLGQVFWALRESKEIAEVQQKCFTTLLKAAKLDPNHFESFLYLGYFYKDIQQNLVKAKRCFQKAYDLNPGSDQSGCALVDILVELEEEVQSLKILELATSQAAAGQVKWAWLRLGLHQIKHDDPTTAITSLQSALRADPNDNHVWECLAEAYLQRGSFTASLKAFSKASELDPNSLYCLYKIANIKHTLGSLKEAIEEYKIILVKLASYVPVLKGVAESLIQLGRQNLSNCLDGLAQDNFEEAILYLTRAASQRPDMSCLWKLLGDACTAAHCLASDNYSVPGKLLGKSHDSQDKGLKQVNKLELLKIGASCYSQALKIFPDSGSLWHDLSVILYHQSSHISLSDPTSHDGQALLSQATQAVRKAIILEPKDWRHWNVLGVIACCNANFKPALAQHCFIKSIECEASNVTAWTNLGAFYLSNNEIELAHNAFKTAQSVDPTYMASWIGQAMIAEIVDSEEAMDLFRHTTELGFHVESALGYGHWVLSVLGDSSKRDTEFYQYCIQQMAAVPAAIDALSRYTCRVKTDPVAYNMQGLLFEHGNLLKSAVTALQKALEVADQPTIRESVRKNLARVLSKLGQYEESVSLFEQCSLSSDVENLCLYGLALFKSGKLIEAFKVYGEVLTMVEGKPAMSQVYAALGMVAYKIGDINEAKSQLFKGFQTDPPSIHGLLALCALGLLQEDMTLTTAALQELLKQEDKDKFLKDISLLQMYKFLLEDDKEVGLTQLQEVVKANPENEAVCSLLWNVTLELAKSVDYSKAVDAALTSLSLGESKTQQLFKSLGQLLLGFHHRLQSNKNAFKTAQRAFHTNPGCLSSLSVLACGTYAEAVIRKALKGDDQLFKVEKGFLELLLEKDLTPELNSWCLQMLIINSIELCDAKSAQSFLSKFQDKKTLSKDEELFVKAITSCLTSQTGTGETTNHSIYSRLQILVNYALCYKHKRFDECLKTMKMLSSNAVPNGFYWERISHAVFCGLQEIPDDSNFQQTLEEAQSLNSQELKSPIISVIGAIRALSADDKKRAKYFFATALDQVDPDREIGYCSSLVRQWLVKLLWDSAKEGDQKLLSALMDDAKEKRDTKALELYKELLTKK